MPQKNERDRVKKMAFEKGRREGFIQGVEWERGRKVESFQIPIERNGKEVLVTVVKKAEAK